MSRDQEGEYRRRMIAIGAESIKNIAEQISHEPLTQIELCLIAAIEIATDITKDDREAFDRVDVVFTTMFEEYFRTIAHDEQSKKPGQ